MAEVLTASIEGLPELLASFDEFDQEATEIVGKNVAIAATNIEGGAKTRAPVLKVPRMVNGALYSGGRLRQSIHKYFDTDGPGTAEVRVEVDYAAPVELGHRTSAGTFVPGQPFLFPALEEERPKFYERLSKDLSDLIERRKKA